MYRATRRALSALGLAASLLALPATAQDAEIAAPASGGLTIDLPSATPAPAHAAPAVLYDNGAYINSTGTGAGGADESVLQSVSLGMNTLGFGHQTSAGNTISDDIIVPSGGWDIDEVVFYAYQTGSTTTSTITAVYVQIWDGDPSDPASSIIWGDLVTNRLASTAWTGVYRVTETSGGDTNRPIMANTATVDVTLPAGTYWVEWQTDGSGGSGPWAPPITLTGQEATGNAMQWTGVWAPALDSGGTMQQQGFPFVVLGNGGGSVDIAYLGSTDTPQRDDFVFVRAQLSNSTASAVPTRVYMDVLYPNGATRRYSVGSASLPAGASLQVQKIKRMKIPVPSDAPAGTYTVTLNASEDIAAGGLIYDSDVFTFDLPPMPMPKAGDLASGVEAGPNPFRSETTIRYTLADAAEVDLRVFDVTGREVAALASGVQGAGAHAAAFAAGDLPNGVYVWRLAAGGEVTTGRVTLAR